MNASAPLIEFRDVTASYSGAVILQGISFKVGAAETVGLVGRNGAGKTTTLLSVYGIPRVRGEILISGEPLHNRRKHEPATRGVALVPQGKRIFGNLTVQENILLGRVSGRTGDWNLDTVYDLFPNLAAGRRRLGTSLSGGEQQMLAIGRALMSEPALLMLDEPTEGLAPVIIESIMEALEGIRAQGTALLLVEQHIGMIQRMADRFIALRRGEIVHDAPVSDLDRPDVREMIAL
ncbi:ABC transporter ATP-binding protein [Rhodococcoides fascians]|uniref:ABC transporter ATP-binding protein n=1 Tax=Rhodococcoides fascians TaxID=1828 RepID=UPI0009B8B3AA|nr:ABC transporter ATP-binding protein [Rhodococcus fascians]